MGVSPEFFRRDVNRLVMHAGFGAVVHVTMDDGRDFFVRRVIETFDHSVQLDVYLPKAAKAFVESTSATHILPELVPGRFTPIELSLSNMTSAHVPGPALLAHPLRGLSGSNPSRLGVRDDFSNWVISGSVVGPLSGARAGTRFSLF